MKRKRTIAIKNPQLIRIRNNFRSVLLEAVYRQWDQYHNQDVRKKGSMKYGRLKQELNDLKDRSICQCPRCRASDRNMTFNPIDKMWYCVDYYQEMHRWTAKKKNGVSIRFP